MRDVGYCKWVGFGCFGEDLKCADEEICVPEVDDPQVGHCERDAGCDKCRWNEICIKDPTTGTGHCKWDEGCLSDDECWGNEICIPDATTGTSKCEPDMTC